MFSFKGTCKAQHKRICTFSSVGTSPQAVSAANREAALKPLTEQLIASVEEEFLRGESRRVKDLHL